ncbi:MAG: PKD domain-containing protein [archaeon]
MKKEHAGFLVLTLVVLAFAIFQVNASSVTFAYGNNSIENYYNGGESLRGNINFSLTNQNTNAILRDNFNNSIKLLDFIKLNGFQEGIEYNCTIKNCTSQYTTSAGALNTIHLAANEKKLIGFNIVSGKTNVAITSINLSATSNIGQSEFPGAKIDFVGWNVSNVQTYGYTNESSTTDNYGCLNKQTIPTEELALPSTTNGGPVCQKITLPSSAAFLLGANLTNISFQGYNTQAIMQLYYADDGYIANAPSCTLPQINYSWQTVSCLVQNPGARAGEYYVCISGSNDNPYKIKVYGQSSIKCGGYGTDFGPDYPTGDTFSIFATAKKFNNSQFFVNDNTYSILNENTLAMDSTNYITNTYGTNCTNGCVIPILVTSSIDQNLTFSGALGYTEEGRTVSKINYGLYSINSVNSSLSSGYLNYDIAKANFSLPLNTSQKKLSFYIDSSSLVSDIPINVTPSFSFDVNPKAVLVGIDTTFTLSMDQNVSSVVWKFGDGAPDVTTQTKNTNHKYMKDGTFNLELEVTRQDGKMARKIISIIAGNPTTAFNILINRYTSGLNNMSNVLSSYDSWVGNAILNKLNMTNINNTLNNLNVQFGNSTDADKIILLNQLIALNVPYGIATDASGSLPIDVGFQGINVAPALTLSEGDYSAVTNVQKDNIRLKIIKWDTDNYNVMVNYKQISKQTDTGFIPSFTQIKIDAKGKVSTPANLIIYYPMNQIIFKEDYKQNGSFDQSSGYMAIPINGDKSIEFLIPEKISVADLGMYVTPDMKELGVVVDALPPTPEGGNRPSTAKWFYILLIVIFLVVYLALQEWYKFRYEAHLFKNKDDLYNIINFIFNARVGRNSDNQIMSQLIKYNWSNEQLSYAFRKIDGKRTGMWEIPVFKFIENRKVVREIDKRKQQNSGDGRFIKTNY